MSGFSRASRRGPCPVCGKPDWCRSFPDGFTECMRTESHRTTRNGGYLHWTGDGPAPGGDWRDRLARVPPRRTPPIDPDAAAAAYAVLLDRCPLRDAHRDHLHARGLSDGQIARHGYGSLTAGAQDGVAAGVVAACGIDVVGRVPGLSWRRPGVPALAALPGLLIPVRDQTGRVIRLRVRPDDEAERTTGGKYRWVSSGDRQGGIGSGAPVHVAIPAGPVLTDTDRVGITEGEIKANVAADRLGFPVIAVPGVTVVTDVIPALTRLGAAEAIILYDADTATNDVVARAEARLTEDLVGAGFATYRGTWPARHKGIDDALAAGVLPVLEPRPPAAACAEVLAAKDAEIADLRRQLLELRALHSALVRADRARALGPERVTGVTLVTDLSTVPTGEWKPTPHARIAEAAGIDSNTVPRHLKKLAPVLAEAVETRVEWVPEAVDAETGEVHPGHNQTFSRLKVDHLSALKIIAAAVPTNGKHKNGHGGKPDRGRLCPACGDAGIERTVTDRCAGCGRVLDRHKTRIEPGNHHLEGAPPADPTHHDEGANQPSPVNVFSAPKMRGGENDEPHDQLPLIRPLTDRVRAPVPTWGARPDAPPEGFPVRRDLVGDATTSEAEQGSEERGPPDREATAGDDGTHGGNRSRVHRMNGAAGDDRWTE